MAQYITPTMLIPVAVIALLLTFFFYYWSLSAGPRNILEAARLPAGKPMTFAGKRHPMEKKDALPLLVLTAVYALTAFFRLGALSAPQTTVDLSGGQSAEITLDGPVQLKTLWYFSGLGTGDYNLEYSADGEHWSTLWQRKDDDGKVEAYYWSSQEGFGPGYAMPQKYNDLFKWKEIEFDNPQYVQYLRFTGKENRDGPLELAEVALFDMDGNRVLPTAASPLLDEQDAVPETISWYNSTYFDEIYHARTAQEHIEGVYPYEVSHPPLGKLILSIGIRLFGMTPFGWRFMGALFGVGMLPILYVFLKNMFGKTVAASCGTALFAFDFMHLTQTRIATIDTYGVFFILLMYFFLYRYLTLPAGSSFAKGALPLFLSGLFWGLGASSKWTVIYGGLGLAVLYFIGLAFQCRDWPRDAQGRRAGLGPWLGKTLAFSVLCFIVIPFCIYTASYLPYAQAKGVDLSLANTLSGAGRSLPVLFQNVVGKFTQGADFTAASIPTDSLPGIMSQNQWFMFTYHEGVTDSHPYSSRWYQWLVDARPILYYLDNTSGAGEGLKAAFGCFNNPVVAWGGLFALLTAAAHAFRTRVGKAGFFLLSCLFAVMAVVKVDGVLELFPVRSAEYWGILALLAVCALLYLGFGAFSTCFLSGYSGKALFILVGYLSQLVPWMLIGRTTFEYHYFPSTLFLVLALCWVFDDLMERRPAGWKTGVYGITGGAVALYFLFYPVLVGLMTPTWYTTNLLKWLPSWPF